MNVPKLRFKEFDGEWEACKLGSVTNSFSGGTPSVGNSSYYHGDVPFIRSGEINSEKTELFLTEEGLNNSSAKIVEVGDILYALYGATSGEVSISKIHGAINQAILAIKPIKGYSSQFIMQWLKLQKKKVIGKYLQGGQGNLSGSIVKDLLVKFPNFEEQQKNGEFFEKLDKKIQLQQQKIDLLQEQKKGFLQKMFPKFKKVYPKVRFGEFSEEWKLYKLSEVFVKGGSGGTPKSTNKTYYDGNIPFLGISDISKSRGFIHDTEKHISDEGLKNSAAWIVPSGAISLAMYASVGKLAILNTELATSQAFYNMIFEDDDLRNYVYQCLCKANEFGEWIKLISTGTQANLNADKVKNFEIAIPSNKKEVSKISNLFMQMDQHIILQQYKLNLLKKQKKGFMQQMFI